MLRLPFVLLLNLLNLLRFVWSRALHMIVRAFRKRQIYVEIEVKENYSFGRASKWLSMFKSKPTFLDLRENIKTVAADPDVEGAVVRPQSVSMGVARSSEVIELLDGVRENGKHVVSHAEMAMMQDYLVCTCADEILMTPAGRLYTFGPRFDQYFAGTALERLGVLPQFMHIGEYKVAGNRFVRDEMSDAQEAMMRSLHEGLSDLLRQRVAERRSMPREAVSRLFASAPSGARTATRNNFVDAEVFHDDVANWIEDRGDHRQLGDVLDAEKTRVVGLEEYVESRPYEYEWKPLWRSKKTFAVMDLSGLIVMPGMSVPGASLVIDPDEVLPVLRRIRDDRRYAGLLLHINSPGGSALASDVIWKAIEEVRAVKPVVAYCSDVAASGGYYLAVGADRIVCRPETLTGSIGVVMGKFSVSETVDRLGLGVDSIYDEPGATFTSLVDPLEGRVLENVRDDTRSFYRRFLQRVGNARRLPRRRLHRYARGRVYLGEDAYLRGLIDSTGGLEEAVDMLSELCEMDAEETELSFVAHRKKSLKGMLKQGMAESGGDLLEAVLEPATMAALLKRDPLLALMPFSVKFR